MSVLLLRLAGPLQAWGDSSRFTRRDTRMVPTKSGVLGLLAAADGRRRADEIEDLAHLGFGVRVDQEGSLERDFQTAINWDTGAVMPLSYRYYVADAVFVAAVEGDDALIDALAERVQNPRFSLYLGRRSCPVTGQLYLGHSDKPLLEALRDVDWQASDWYRRRQSSVVDLEIHLDAHLAPQDVTARPVETRRDVPESFNPERREYGWREVVHLTHIIDNPAGWTPQATGVDWLAALEEA